ncbi:MAG: hypothetical protein ACXADU_01630 [Promethearchaeota archaeon]|jgi:hypothetical protein
MALISKRNIVLQGEDVFFQKFVANNGDEYGLRFGNPEDAEEISKIFKEIYGYQYVNPFVYNIDLLKNELANKDNFWFVGELIRNREIAGVGLIEKKRYIAHAGKAAVREKFQGLGVTTKIGAAGIITVTKMPQFKEVLRLDTEARTLEVRVQKLMQNAGAIHYGLIPAYINLGDRRRYKPNNNNNIPFPPKEEEGAFLYSMIFKNLWRKRENKIYLINDENFIFFHDYVKLQCKRMKEDDMVIEKGKKDKGFELYGVSKDPYNGIVSLYNYINEKSLGKLLKTYRKWRIILWKIPTTQNGLHSMALALEKGFNIVGYDVGFNNMNSKLHDSVILAYYPNGGSQVLQAVCLDENKHLYNKVREIFCSSSCDYYSNIN